VAAAALGGLIALTAPPPLQPVSGEVVEVVGVAGTARRTAGGGLAMAIRVGRMQAGGRWRRGRLALLADLPPGSRAPDPGTPVRARGAIGRSPGFANSHPVRAGPWRLRVKAERFLERIGEPGPLARLGARLRARVWAAVAEAERRRPSLPGLRVVRALALGEATALEPVERRALRRVGIGHLVAVSGLHVSIVALLAATVTIPAGRPIRLLATALAVVAYLAVVGPAPSVVRATVTALLVLAALASGRAPETRQALAVVFVGMLASDPERIDEVGFRLSFAATAGLLLLAPRWADRIAPAGPRWIALALSATLAAQTASLPFSVAAFGEVAPAAPLFNLLAGPWAAAVLAAAALWIPTAICAPRLAEVLSPWLDPLALPLRALAELPPSPWLSSPCPGGFPSGLAAAGLVSALAEGGGWRRGGILVLALLPLGGAGRPPSERFELRMLDVGQGDATLLAHGETVFLIDGGGGPPGASAGLRAVRPALALLGASRLAVMIVTHPDADHCGGLVDLVHEVPVEEIWAPAGALDDPCPLALARAAGRPLRALGAGDRLERAGVRLDVLHPGRQARARSSNATSLVARVEAGGRSLLVTGDIGHAEERELVLGQRTALRVDLLRVPHHGSGGSSSLPFLVASRPALALVSAGARNGYGHPASAALGRFRRAGIRLLRTDRDGEVVVRWQAGGPLRISLPASPAGGR
ncbi:MAG TPA: ComEC/Rec2 family competence protein, partial [Thermoanaerobaculia bacterium]|nr:ComEC/Rec2 family competence protein [Thermoanaerobaculia bacterium]